MATPQTDESGSTGFSVKLIFRSIGPALIVACVVLGPGSILTSSKVGCQFGYSMIWLLVLAAILMIGAVSAAARVGVSLDHSPCTELAQRVGRPLAVLAGLSVFSITACFQFSNNLGVLASLEPMLGTDGVWQTAMLIVLNGALICCLFGFKRLYQPLEKFMMVLVGLMLIGFAGNLILAKPSLLEVIRGFLPRLPRDFAASFVPRITQDATGNAQINDPWIVVQGLFFTTFSIAGAFYQAYLVKEKGWALPQLKRGLIDSFVGISVLVGISLMIMTTSASVLHGFVKPENLNTAADVARQLEPLFGPAAKWLFCLGIFAAALSSFLVNSMIGGTMLADGFGLDASIDGKWNKWFTTAVLLTGLIVAMATDAETRVPLIIFAQAVTVLGGPLLVLSLGYLLWCSRVEKSVPLPVWIVILMTLATIVIFALALRTAWRIYLVLQI